MQFELEHITERTNADGSKRYYFRRRGQPVVRLTGEPLSDEFMATYRKCLEWRAPAAAQTEGSFAWVCDQYMDSTAFTSKADATRNARRRVMLTMTNEKLDPERPEIFGEERFKSFTLLHLEILRDRKAENPNAANERIKILRQIYKLAVKRKWAPVNLARDIEPLAVPKGGHDTATDADIEKYLAFHTQGPAHLAGMLLKHTGVRVSDLRVIGLQHVKKGVLTFTTVKTGVLCELPIPPELAAVLPKERMTFLHSDDDVPFQSDKALSQRVSKWFRQAGVPDGITAHSVRKWRATKMAESGASEYQLMASFGWSDPKEARPYVQAANRKMMAQEAVTKLGSV